ncbi:thermonuclease family protein [Amorphus orientalis]|uniref:TNase-like domain-containing protein n=1 Tax=Amorphus orientalis TaxID=649198 RepID=A0AAE3VKQ3_9HYPH|nr:hypothetical protein [Amorphus orientalis]MDQ0313792.1 hypothetical protein [Amorphus orientalis]
MLSYSRQRRRSQAISRALYALVVVCAAAISVVPLLLIDDAWFGPVTSKMDTLPLAAPNDDPQNASDWGGKFRPQAAGEEGQDAAAGQAGAPEPEASVRDVSSNEITRSPNIAAPLQRLPSAVEVPPPLPPEPVRYFLVVVEDALTISADGLTLKMAHVTGPSTFESCQEGSPVKWSCDIRARTALRKLVGARAIECMALDEETARKLEEAARAERESDVAGPVAADCTVGSTDIAGWLVSQGWAQPTEEAPDRLKVLSWIAQGQKRGLWQPIPPTTQ